jgi:hypothetical protein
MRAILEETSGVTHRLNAAAIMAIHDRIERLRITLTIYREGIELFGLKYSCEALALEVALGRKRIVRYDAQSVASLP